MSTSNEVAASVLKLRTDEFFADQPDLDSREFRLLDAGFEGVAVSAPESVNVDKPGKLPIVVAVGKTTRRQWEVHEPKNLSVIVWEPETAKIHVADASPPRVKRPPEEIVSRMPPEPDEEPPYARLAGVRRLEDEIMDRLALPWRPGSLRAACVHFDWLSNVAAVELTGEDAAPEGEPVEIDPEPSSEGGEAGGLLKKARTPLPSYESGATTPSCGEPGAAVSIPSKLVTSDRLPVYGAFAVPAREWHVDDSDTVHMGLGERKLPVVAIVPVTLLIFALDLPDPLRFDLGVPVYGQARPRPGEMLHGSFAINALAGEDAHLAAGEYAAYVICDTEINGPATFTV